MIKLIFNTTNNKPAIFYANSSEQAVSILKMKEDALYYDFLLKNQKVQHIKIGQRLVKYILGNLEIDYVECPSSAVLDSLVKDKVEDLFKLSKFHNGVKKYLQFNFRLLHQSFINSALNPLAVITKNDTCKESPEFFIKKETSLKTQLGLNLLPNSTTIH